jgi:peptidoglycan/LPS O-acetylase OafA/YrhL
MTALPETESEGAGMVRGESVPLSTQLDSGGRIASLDGLRAISIALVVGYHAINAAAQVKVHRDYRGPWEHLLNGELGVSIFFVISGFLITHLLLREMRKTGTVSLKDFYIRRTFRIWPAFFFYLGIVVLLYWVHVFGIARRDVVAAGAFVFNYVPHVGNPLVAHSWSLSVEEQFYLFWPILLLSFGSRRAIRIAVAFVLVCPMVRLAEMLTLPASSMFIVRMWEMTHTRIDTLMFGCLVALTADDEKVQRVIDRCIALRLHLVAVVYLFFGWSFLSLFLPLSVRMGIGDSIQGVCITLLVVCLVRYARSPVGRLFNSRAMVHLGAISYSLYLWNPIFCIPQNKSWTGMFPANVFCSLAMAEVSYFAIEQPFLRARSRFFSKRKSPQAS